MSRIQTSTGQKENNGSVALKPLATESPPVTKKISFSKISGGRWSVDFSPNITRLDVNHLARLIRIEFVRAKRRKRIQDRIAKRKQETPNA